MANLLHHRNSFSTAQSAARYGSASAAAGSAGAAGSAASSRSPSRSTTASLHKSGYVYKAHWPIYALDWTRWPPSSPQSYGNIAIGSYIDDCHNKLQVITAYGAMEDSSQVRLQKIAESEHYIAYPVTKCLWEPVRMERPQQNLLATSGEHLRLWSLENRSDDDAIPVRVRQQAIMANSKQEFAAPLTSFDWCQADPSLIVTASIDTTCTAWDIHTQQAKTQLIAHDQEVFDVAFVAQSSNIFVSVGADGSVRMFDLRSLDHSTIVYEQSVASGSGVAAAPGRPPRAAVPLLRLSPSGRDPNLLATFSVDSSVAHVLDVRSPGQSLLDLCAHQGSLSSVQWSPNRANMLATGADDCQVLIWDLASPKIEDGSRATTGGPSGNTTTKVLREPHLAWTADYEVNSLSWSHESEFIGVAHGKLLQGLKI